MGMTLPTILAVRDFHTFLSDISGGFFFVCFLTLSLFAVGLRGKDREGNW